MAADSLDLGSSIHVFYFTVHLTFIVVSGKLYTFSGKDVLNVLNNSCLIAGLLPLETDLNHLLIQTEAIFKEQLGVTVGTINRNQFVWPSGEKLKIKYNDIPPSLMQRQLVVFKKRIIDRTCLLKPEYNVWRPQPVLHSVPSTGTIEELVTYVNSVCGTFRTSRGSMSPAGYHREEILGNLFKMDSVSAPNMAAIYCSPSISNNQLNSSCMLEAPSMECEDTCLSDTKCHFNLYENKNLYISNTKDKEHKAPKISDCIRLKVPPTKDEFFNLYLKRSLPIVIESITSKWPAFRKWTSEFLVKKYKDRDVHIKLTPGGDYEGVEDIKLWDNYETFPIPKPVRDQLPYADLVVVRPAHVNMKFAVFMDMINRTAHSKDRNVSAYMEYSSHAESFPGTEEDIVEPEFVQKVLNLKHTNVWLSDGSTLGKLHFDPFDNLLCQLSGKKQLILFDPHDNKKLYEAHIQEATLEFNAVNQTFHRRTLHDSTSMVMSPVDILNPNFKRFKYFADAVPLNCTINEGDMLFLPAFWWHEVQSFPSQTENRNLAVNYWYEPFLTKEFPCPECKLDINPIYHYLLH